MIFNTGEQQEAYAESALYVAAIYLGPPSCLNSQSLLASTMKLVILNSFDAPKPVPFSLDAPISAPGGAGVPLVPEICSPPKGSRGTLKKSNTSRYSSSLGAGVLAGVTLGNLLRALGCLGCREMRKSKSNAVRRISERILTELGVIPSPCRSLS